MNKTRLPHLLAPSAYASPAHHEREQERIFTPGWHFVATSHELVRPGDSLRRTVLQRPLLARNHHGAFEVFELPQGLPQRPAQEMAPLPTHARRRLRTGQLGALLFASFASRGPGLREQLGERTWSLGERIFLPSSRLAVAREMAHPCNWKIPLENVLESYHVPSLHTNFLARHPDLFKVFSGSKTGQVHELGEHFTAYHDSLGADSSLYRALIGQLRPGASFEYVHHHAYPNIVFGHTSIVSFLQVIEPTSPSTSRSVIRLLLDLGQTRAGLLERLATPLLQRAASRLIEMVLREDAAVYPDVQRGLESSLHPGVLGSREERIHAFQRHIAAACAE